MVATEQSSVSYALAAGVTQYGVPFPYRAAADVRAEYRREIAAGVWVRAGGELTQGVDYTVSAPSDLITGGTAVFLAGPPAGAARIYIWRRTPETQEKEFENGARLDAKVLERAFDKGMMVSQEHGGRLDAAEEELEAVKEELEDVRGDLNTEAAARIAADQAEAAARRAADQAEAQARLAADQAERFRALDAELSLQHQISAEALARLSGDQAEAAARQSAVSAVQQAAASETAARIEADAAETQEREQAVLELQEQINDWGGWESGLSAEREERIAALDGHNTSPEAHPDIRAMADQQEQFFLANMASLQTNIAAMWETLGSSPYLRSSATAAASGSLDLRTVAMADGTTVLRETAHIS
jgi:hypothetical protein